MMCHLQLDNCGYQRAWYPCYGLRARLGLGRPLQALLLPRQVPEGERAKHSDNQFGCHQSSPQVGMGDIDQMISTYEANFV